MLPLYFPEEQSVQGTFSERSLNLPATQAEQGGSPLALENPAMQRQSDSALDPVLTPVPELEGQAVQAAADAVTALKVPAAHTATLQPAPLKPESARQSASSSEPSALPLFDGQASQVSAV